MSLSGELGTFFYPNDSRLASKLPQSRIIPYMHYDLYHNHLIISLLRFLWNHTFCLC